MASETFGAGASLDIRSELVFVVYDSRTGDIRHVHRSFAAVGALPADRERSRALEMARQFGHGSQELGVLQVDPRGPDPGVALRVNVDRKQLEIEGG